jgi:hypothetical protein
MSVSERAPGNALGWPAPLACLYSLAMETGIRVRDYPHDHPGPAAIVADGKGIGLRPTWPTTGCAPTCSPWPWRWPS